MSEHITLVTSKKVLLGFSLIEVMVALVILVVGVIGVFNLHLVAKRGSFESFQQMQAAHYANDIVNRMKLNPKQLVAYAGKYSGELPKPNVECDAAVGEITICTPEQTQVWDLYQWEQNLVGATEMVGDQKVGGLDNPEACINVVDNSVTVAIAWRGIRAGAGTSYATTDCGQALGDRRRLFTLTTMIL